MSEKLVPFHGVGSTFSASSKAACIAVEGFTGNPDSALDLFAAVGYSAYRPVVGDPHRPLKPPCLYPPIGFMIICVNLWDAAGIDRILHTGYVLPDCAGSSIKWGCLPGNPP